MIKAASARVVLFKALGDGTRHLIMQVLSHQELAVNELVEVLGLPQSTVSRHLRVLRQAGLIGDRREGVTVYCRAHPEAGKEDPIAGSICRGLQDEVLPTEVATRVETALTRRRQRSSTFFDERGEKWDELRRGCFGQEFPLEALLGLLPGEWVAADLGTGTGYLLPALGRAFRRVIAVDSNASMLDRARRRVTDQELGNVDVRWGELEALPIEAGQIDLAVAVLVLHHVSDPAHALAEIARVLRPGGRLLIVELAEHQDEELRQAMGDLWMGFSPARLSTMSQEVGMGTDRVMTLSGTHREETRARRGRSLFAVIIRKEEDVGPNGPVGEIDSNRDGRRRDDGESEL